MNNNIDLELNNINRFPSCGQNLNMELFFKYEKEIAVSLKEDRSRYFHSISVALTAVNLADVYGADKDDCLVSGLLHDYCKCIPIKDLVPLCEKNGVKLTDEDKMADGCIHGFLAAKICKDKYNINDKVYDAIYFHTCGRPNMTILEKIIFMSDFIEPLRKFRDMVSDIRELTFKDIDKAIIFASELNLEFLVKKDKYIHTNTIKTLEYYKDLIEKRK